jgi:uncharacterized repeat protein (TIGR03837 family)
LSSIDIFSKYIDNFGDLTIAIRIANEFSKSYEFSINLFITKNKSLETLLKLNPVHKNILIRNIDYIDEVYVPSKKIITIFDTKIPSNLLKKISSDSLIINYEYFSAEKWVDGYHLKKSFRTPCKKIYYFPGISNNSGSPIYSQEDLNHFNKSIYCANNNFSITCFSYFNQSIFNSLSCLKENFPSSKISVFDGLEFNKSLNNIGINCLPLKSFNDFDSQLSESTINFIRGEDSLVRAILSDGIFFWQPYNQTNNEHDIKLKAFFNYYFHNPPKYLKDLFLKWSTEDFTALDWEFLQSDIYELSKLYSFSRKKFISRPSAIEEFTKCFNDYSV